MYCPYTFKFICSNEVCRNFDGIGNFLFFKENDSEMKMYVSLNRKREDSFLCIYNEKKSKGYKYEYEKIYFTSEKELWELLFNNPYGVDTSKHQYFEILRSSPTSTIDIDGWVERKGTLLYKEEIEFLKGLSPNNND